MASIVFTSRVWYTGEDRFDITRMSGGPSGSPFAPSENLLRGYQRDLRKAVIAHDVDEAKHLWQRYRVQYTYEMERSLRSHSDAWKKLIERDRVVLVCYCPSPDRCHRGVLADMLVDFGCAYRGEIDT